MGQEIGEVELKDAELVVPGIVEHPEVVAAFLLVVVAGGAEGFEAADFGLDRQRWIAAMTVGYDGRGKRIVRRGSGRTKTEAKAKLRALLRDRDDGVVLGAEGYTVGQAVEDWLAFGLGKQGESTVANYRLLCSTHIIPLFALGS